MDDVWDFFELFKFDTIYVSDYRKRLIYDINKKYTSEQFFAYENIINNLFWDLRDKLIPIWIDKIRDYPSALTLCQIIKYENDIEKNIKIDMWKMNTFYRSFINKLIIDDTQNNTLYLRKMEGSSGIFIQNQFNLQTFTIMSNRSLYESIMENPMQILSFEIKLPEFYYEQDYGFPNLNFCVRSIGSDDIKKRRIIKMYYENDCERNWFAML